MNDINSGSGELVFSVFIYLCGEGEHVSPLDAKRVGELMADPGWARSARMREGLCHLRREYVNLWKDYSAAGNPIDHAALQARWLAACQGLSSNEICDLFDDIVKLASELSERRGKTGESRRKAVSAIEDLLRSVAADRAAEASLEQIGLGAIVEPIKVPDQDGQWWSKGSIRISCVAVIRETHDVKTFVFRAVDGRRFCYKPGQAAVLQVPIGGSIIKRSYSLSSSPSRPDRVAITVKRVENGLVSSWLHENMQPRIELEIGGPFGKLTCVDHPAQKILLVSAGSGVTPMMSMLRYLHDTCAPVDVVFLNNIRTPRDIIFGYELNAMAATMCENLSLAIVPSSRFEGTVWNGATGNICETLLRTLVPDCADREVFCCGPDGYRVVVREALASMGHPVERYHEEIFGTPSAGISAPRKIKSTRDAPPVTAPALPEKAPITAVSSLTSIAPVLIEPISHNFQIRFAKSGRSVPCAADEAILDVAERAAIPLESSCRAGKCGTCRVKTLEGSAIMDDFGVLSDDEIAEGFVLACSARVSGDLVVDC
jgi:ferredoxin-NADP reductase